MMSTKKLTLAAAAWLLSGTPMAFAADPPMSAPKPPKELSQLAYFQGRWTCTGKVFASPLGPEHATAGKFSSAPVLDGWWVSFRYDETKTAINPSPIQAAGFMGYDPGEKTFVQRCHDSLGGYCQQTSPGWNADVMTFEGPGSMDGQKMRMRDTYTRKGAAVLVHSGEIQGPDGQWLKTDEETCNRTATKP
jgi:hypothetical protein